MSGWCITDDHDVCPRSSHYKQCTCECHEENDEAVHGQVEVVEEAAGLDPEVEAAQGIEDDTQ
jgi:hypothetical protein